MGEIFRKKPLRKTLTTAYEDINEAIDEIKERLDALENK